MVIPFLFEQGRGERGRFGGGDGRRRRLGRTAPGTARTTSPSTTAPDFRGQPGDLLVETVVLGFHLRESGEEELILLFHLDFFVFEFFHLEPLAFARGLGSRTVP